MTIIFISKERKIFCLEIKIVSFQRFSYCVLKERNHFHLRKTSKGLKKKKTIHHEVVLPLSVPSIILLEHALHSIKLRK